MLGRAWSQLLSIKPRDDVSLCFSVRLWSFRLSLCMEASACVCVYKRLALCPPVILLSPWTMEEQLAWPSCALQHRAEERWCAQHSDGEQKTEKDGQSIYWSIFLTIYLFYLSSSFPQVTGGAILALELHPFSWLNTGTDVVERLRGPLVPLVQQQGLGAAGEDFSNQFYWSYAIRLAQQGQAQSPATLQCKCVQTEGICVCLHPEAITQIIMCPYLSFSSMQTYTHIGRVGAWDSAVWQMSSSCFRCCDQITAWHHNSLIYDILILIYIYDV